MIDQALPLKTIYTPSGEPYISVIDNSPLVRLQVHSYDAIRPVFVNFDKQALPELIRILQEIT